MMDKFKGSSLAQYCIIIALVALAITPVLFMLSSNLVSIFTNYDTAFGEIADKAKDNTPKKHYDSINQMTNGSLDVDCTSGECVFKAGDLTIKGIPDDFSSLVETTGVSSGTETLVEILDQIVVQLENTALTEDTDNIRELANLGHQLAQVEYEMTTYECTDNQAYCVFDVNPDLVVLDDNFRDSILSFESQLTKVIDSISSNPELSAIIQQPSNEIISLANSFTTSIDDDKHSCHYVFTNVVESYNHISTVTDIDSAVICASGHGDDNGYDCD